jgi:cbb3-type cytochrome oxidase subunit 1
MDMEEWEKLMTFKQLVILTVITLWGFYCIGNPKAYLSQFVYLDVILTIDWSSSKVKCCDVAVFRRIQVHYVQNVKEKYLKKNVSFNKLITISIG